LDTQSLIARFGLVTATFIVGLVSALFPPVNIEVFLLGVAAIAKPAALPAIVVSAALGQMVGKIGFYFAGRGLMKLPLGRYQAKFDEWSVRLGRSRRGVDVVMFSSSLWGVPPFLVVPYLAGVFKLSFARFLGWGMLGRLLRFSAVVSLPALLKVLAQRP
jgi:membrane protein YqaA with SNARE-associated domain